MENSVERTFDPPKHSQNWHMQYASFAQNIWFSESGVLQFCEVLFSEEAVLNCPLSRKLKLKGQTFAITL